MKCDLTPSEITVGDIMELNCSDVALQFQATDKLEIKYDGAKHLLNALGFAKTESGGLKLSVTSYLPGDHNLKNVKIARGSDEVVIPEMSFKVKSILPTQAQPTPIPSFGPLRAEIPNWWWFMCGFLVLIVVSVLGALIWRFIKSRKKAEIEAKSVLSPKELFAQQLRKLESHGYHLKGQYKSFALELTLILKRAIGLNFTFNAEDMTSEELVDVIERKYKPFHRNSGALLKSMLSELDQIKFAKISSSPEQCAQLIDQAQKIGKDLFGVGP